MFRSRCLQPLILFFILSLYCPASAQVPAPTYCGSCTGISSASGLSNPDGLQIDNNLNVAYVSNSNANEISAYDATTYGFLSSSPSTSQVITDATFNSKSGFDYVFGTAVATNSIYEFTFTPPSSWALVATFSNTSTVSPRGIVFVAGGGAGGTDAFYLNDQAGQLVRFDGSGTSYSAAATVLSSLNAPCGMTLDGNVIYIADTANASIQPVTITAGPAYSVGAPIAVGGSPRYVVPRGTGFIVSDGNINFYDSSWIATGNCPMAGTPWGCAVDNNGNLMIALANANALTMIGCNDPPNTATATATSTATRTFTSTATHTRTPTTTSTATATSTATRTMTTTATRTSTSTSTFTATIISTETATNTVSTTATASFTATPIATSTVTTTQTETKTPTLTNTGAPTNSPTIAFTLTPVPGGCIDLPMAAYPYPNPASGNNMNVYCSLCEPGSVTVTLYNTASERVGASTFRGQSGSNVTSVNISGYAHGVYYLFVRSVGASGTRKSGMVKFAVTR